MDNNVAMLLMARHMAQYGEYNNPMIRGQCDPGSFSTSKETIAGLLQCMSVFYPLVRQGIQGVAQVSF